jgi:hypothetical protein
MESLVNTPAACIKCAKKAIGEYPLINSVITDDDYSNWETFLSSQQSDSGCFGYVYGSDFSLLSSSIASVHEPYPEFEDRNLLAQILLKKLNTYLEAFPEMLKNIPLHDKLVNTGNVNFAATLSELSIAYRYQKAGFKVEFERKFGQKKKGDKKDVDLVITSPAGQQFNLEVYMPINKENQEGFLDISEDNDEYAFKVNRKLTKKFGEKDFTGLEGYILLAVNVAFLPFTQVQRILTPSAVIRINKHLGKQLLDGVDALLVFADNFHSMDSYQEIGIFEREKQTVN